MLTFFVSVVEIQDRWIPLALMTAGLCSALAAFFGIKNVMATSSRTTHTASNSLNAGLKMIFRNGAIMLPTIVGLALLDYLFRHFILN
jgi:K(+)-stimulated pyrophosphate-energized sodium pump